MPPQIDARLFQYDAYGLEMSSYPTFSKPSGIILKGFWKQIEGAFKFMVSDGRLLKVFHFKMLIKE